MTPPEATSIVFVRTKKGRYSARIDNVKVSLDHSSFDIVSNGDSYFMGGISSFKEVERMVRDVFNNQWKYQAPNDPCAEPWPESAAQRFGKHPWPFDPPPSQPSAK